MQINRDQELVHWRRIFRIVIAASRIDANLSQQKIADLLQVTRNTVANLETGRRVIEAAEVPLIAKALDCNPEMLFRRVLMWRRP